MSEEHEDEWDSAESRIKELEKKAGPQQATRLMLRSPASNAPSPAPGASSPQSEPTGIDEAILGALNNPRERMVVLQFENKVLNFMNSGAKTMEIPSGYNSFQRLLAYRIGDRFRLSHNTSDHLNEVGERIIYLFKTPTSSIPAKLLVDVDLSSSQSQSAGASSPSGAPTTEPGVQPRKMLVMKRQTAGGAQSNTKGVPTVRQLQQQQQQQSAEDKEKAYLEARARIFGEADAPTPDGSCSSPINSQDGDGSQPTGGTSTPRSDVAVRPAGGSVNSLTTLDSTYTGSGQISKNTSSNSLAGGIAAASRENNSRSSSSSRPQTNAPSSGGLGRSPSANSLGSGGADSTGGNTGGGGAARGTSAGVAAEEPADISRETRSNVVNAGEWKGKKGQLRNPDAERADPDFKRQPRPATGGRHPASKGGSGSGGSGGSGGDPYYRNAQGVPAYSVASSGSSSPMTAAGQHLPQPQGAQVSFSQQQYYAQQAQQAYQYQYQFYQQQQMGAYYPAAAGAAGFPGQPSVPFPPAPPGAVGAFYAPMPPQQAGMPYAPQYPALYAPQGQMQAPSGPSAQSRGGGYGAGFSNADFPPLG